MTAVSSSSVSASSVVGSRSPSSSAKASGSTSISSTPASAAPSRASVGEAVPGEQQLRAGVLEVEGDLAPLQQHVHRHDDAAGAEHAVVGDRELEDVGQHHPDPVALLQPFLAQQRRQAGAAVVEFARRSARAAPRRTADRLRRPLGALGDDRSEIQAHRSSPVIVVPPASLSRLERDPAFARLAAMDDLGAPLSYLVLEQGSPSTRATGSGWGGWSGALGDRPRPTCSTASSSTPTPGPAATASSTPPRSGEIYERGVVLTIDAAEAESLPKRRR